VVSPQRKNTSREGFFGDGKRNPNRVASIKFWNEQVILTEKHFAATFVAWF